MVHRDDPKERLSFLRPQALPGVELLSAYDSLDPWHVFHERYDVCVCRTAETGMVYRGRHHPILDGSTSFFEPGESHRNTRVYKRSDFKVLFIEPHAMMRAAGALGCGTTPHFRLAQVGDRQLFDSVYGLCESVERGADALEQQSRFAECIAGLLRCAERTPRTDAMPSPAAIERAKAHLLARFNENVTLDELAGIAGLSPYHLLRSFKRRLGMPPHRFLVHVRVERAALMLRHGVLPAEAATAVGFADQSHLNRHFRRIWGITAAGYAQLG